MKTAGFDHGHRVEIFFHFVEFGFFSTSSSAADRSSASRLVSKCFKHNKNAPGVVARWVCVWSGTSGLYRLDTVTRCRAPKEGCLLAAFQSCSLRAKAENRTTAGVGGAKGSERKRKGRRQEGRKKSGRKRAITMLMVVTAMIKHVLQLERVPEPTQSCEPPTQSREKRSNNVLQVEGALEPKRRYAALRALRNLCLNLELAFLRGDLLPSRSCGPRRCVWQISAVQLEEAAFPLDDLGELFQPFWVAVPSREYQDLQNQIQYFAMRRSAPKPTGNRE